MKNVLRSISILLICSVIAGLLGCASGDEIYPELTETELNIPQYKTNETLTFTADVYYESVDTGELTACERVIEHSNSISRAEAVLNALSQEPEDKKLRSAMIKGLTFESLVMSNGICDVYITGVFPSFTDSWHTLCSAVALTLCSTYDEIDAVNVMFDGKSVGYYSMLMGLLDEDNARSGSRSADDDCIPELYYAGKDVYGAQSVIAYKGENAPIKCDTPLIDAARTLIEALYEPSDAELTGIPRELSVFGIAFRSGESITMEYDARISPSPEPAETDDGEPPFDVAYDTPLNIMEVVFSAKDDTRSVDFNAVAAMVTLTLTSSIPEIDGVRICCSEDGVQIAANAPSRLPIASICQVPSLQIDGEDALRKDDLEAVAEQEEHREGEDHVDHQQQDHVLFGAVLGVGQDVHLHRQGEQRGDDEAQRLEGEHIDEHQDQADEHPLVVAFGGWVGLHRGGVALEAGQAQHQQRGGQQ